MLGVAASTPKHGRSPKERGLSLAQWPCVRRLPTPTCAALRARAACARAVPPPMKERKRSGASALRDAALNWCWASQLARRSTAVHRRREASRWNSGLVYGAYRLQPARRARARGMRALCAPGPEKERERSGACPQERRHLLGVAEARRSTAVHRRREASTSGAVALCTAPTDSNLRGAARARGMRACCCRPPRKRKRAHCASARETRRLHSQ